MADIDTKHIHPEILKLAKEIDAEVTLTGAVSRFGPAKNQALLNGRFVGFYAQESFGGTGKEGWQLGSGRLKGTRAQALHFVTTGELPVDGVAAPRKALPAKKEQTEQNTQSSTTTAADPIVARLNRIAELKAAGISDELIALALKG